MITRLLIGTSRIRITLGVANFCIWSLVGVYYYLPDGSHRQQPSIYLSWSEGDLYFTVKSEKFLKIPFRVFAALLPLCPRRKLL